MRPSFEQLAAARDAARGTVAEPWVAHHLRHALAEVDALRADVERLAADTAERCETKAKLCRCLRETAAERDTLRAQLAALAADNERLAHLLATTRNADLVAMTADRDSWERQAADRSEDAVRAIKRADAWREYAQAVHWCMTMMQQTGSVGSQERLNAACAALLALGETP